MLHKLWLAVLMLMIVAMPFVHAVDSTYNVVVEENGMALVVIELSGRGLAQIPLQADVEEVKVKGALYSIENSSIAVSIGSTEKAVILYKTALLTSKSMDAWVLSMHLVNNTQATVSLPKYAYIKETKPTAFLSEGSYNKVIFTGANDIMITYGFKNNATSGYLPYVIGGIALVALAVVAVAFRRQKKPAKASNKDKILKTLSQNERLIVNTMIEHGEMKRSELEKRTKMAKSSLANTLNNLEKKNIIEIDKTYTAHFVKFTGWFSEL